MWIELHQELARHPKVANLAEALEVSRPAALGTLTFLWLFTAEFAPTGNLAKHSTKRLCEACAWTGDPDRLISALVEIHWLDRRANGTLRIHDWDDHSGKWVRWARHRNDRKRRLRGTKNGLERGTRTAQSRHTHGTVQKQRRRSRGTGMAQSRHAPPDLTRPNLTRHYQEQDTHAGLAAPAAPVTASVPERSGALQPKDKASAHLTPASLGALWNALIPDPQVHEITGKRLAAARTRLREHPDSAWWRQVLERLLETPFLRGAGERGWKADFDWLVRNDTNALRVLEGSYLEHGTVRDRMATHQAALDAMHDDVLEEAGSA